MAKYRGHHLHTEAVREEREAKKARRAAEARLKFLAHKARPVEHPLRVNHNVGIIVLKGASAKGLLEGLEHRTGSDRLRMYEAQGTVQGEDRGYEFGVEVVSKMSALRHDHGDEAVVGFTDFDFSDTATKGTPQVFDRVSRILTQQNIRGRTFKNSLRIIIAGPGDPSDLPTHVNYTNRPHHPLAVMLASRLCLDESGELSAPNLDTYSNEVTEASALGLNSGIAITPAYGRRSPRSI